LIDGDVLVAGELPFDPRPALRAQTGGWASVQDARIEGSEF
jgi:hypothetical protein